MKSADVANKGGEEWWLRTRSNESEATQNESQPCISGSNTFINYSVLSALPAIPIHTYIYTYVRIGVSAL